MSSMRWTAWVVLGWALGACGDDGTPDVPPDAGSDATTDSGPRDVGTPDSPDVGEADAGPMCLPATEPCEDEAQCCSELACGHTTLGQVCCGGEGVACVTPNGEDCCGLLECIDGICTTDEPPSGHAVEVFPVRGRHNLGYDRTAGDRSEWSCDDGHSNSDFVAGDHIGNDIWAARNTPVVATAPGTLILTGWSDYSGNKVTIRTADGWEHFMCHLDHLEPGIGNGVRVTAGQIVGYVGNTGTASNGVVHLHISIYPPGDYDRGVDPWPLLHAVEHDTCD